MPTLVEDHLPEPEPPQKSTPIRVDIRDYPDLIPDDFAKAGSLEPIGDLHANAVKALHLLLLNGVLQRVSESGYQSLVEDSLDHQRLIDALADQDAEEKKNAFRDLQRALSRFERLLNKATVSVAACPIFLGDTLCDRAMNCLFMLQIFKKLDQAGLEFPILLSDHDVEFLTRLRINEEKVSYEAPRGLHDSTVSARSFWNLKKLAAASHTSYDGTQEKLCTDGEIKELVSIYKKHWVPRYAKKINGKIHHFSHALVGLEILPHFYKMYCEGKDAKDVFPSLTKEQFKTQLEVLFQRNRYGDFVLNVEYERYRRDGVYRQKILNAHQICFEIFDQYYRKRLEQGTFTEIFRQRDTHPDCIAAAVDPKHARSLEPSYDLAWNRCDGSCDFVRTELSPEAIMEKCGTLAGYASGKCAFLKLPEEAPAPSAAGIELSLQATFTMIATLTKSGKDAPPTIISPPPRAYVRHQDQLYYYDKRASLEKPITGRSPRFLSIPLKDDQLAAFDSAIDEATKGPSTTFKISNSCFVFDSANDAAKEYLDRISTITATAGHVLMRTFDLYLLQEPSTKTEESSTETVDTPRLFYININPLQKPVEIQLQPEQLQRILDALPDSTIEQGRKSKKLLLSGAETEKLQRSAGHITANTPQFGPEELFAFTCGHDLRFHNHHRVTGLDDRLGKGLQHWEGTYYRQNLQDTTQPCLYTLQNNVSAMLQHAQFLKQGRHPPDWRRKGRDLHAIATDLKKLTEDEIANATSEKPSLAQTEQFICSFSEALTAEKSMAVFTHHLIALKPILVNMICVVTVLGMLTWAWRGYRKYKQKEANPKPDWTWKDCLWCMKTTSANLASTAETTLTKLTKTLGTTTETLSGAPTPNL